MAGVDWVVSSLLSPQRERTVRYQGMLSTYGARCLKRDKRAPRPVKHRIDPSLLLQIQPREQKR